MPPEPLMEPVRLDLVRIVADKEAIRKVNPQRFELEQLDAIALVDPEQELIVGYRDIRSDEFWVRGHLPDYPLFPGVLMCEAAAQLCSYYVATQAPVAGDFLGFGGMENVRFRGSVRPGDRLVLVGKASRLKPRQTIFNVQGFVGPTMVFHAEIIGVALRKGER
jgi:3-hydroxyacyl-[acyl-carrier-protein] dehydratase